MSNNQHPAQDEREAVERFSPTTSVPHCGRASEVEAYMTVNALSFVQPVPDHCDRIVWRERYYHLPLDTESEQAPVQDEREAVERFSPTTSVPHCGRASEVEAYMTDDDDGEYMTVAQHERIAASLTSSAQTEQQPEQSGLLEALDWLDTEVSAIDTWYRGSPSYEHGAGWFKDEVLRLIEGRRAALSALSAQGGETK